MHFRRLILAPPAMALLPALLAADEPAASPAYEVIGTRVEYETRVQPPPLPDMEPVEKTVTITVQEVAPPDLPDPPPVAAPQEIDPEKAAAFRARLAQRPPRVWLFLSATVHDHGHTLLRWRSPGPQGTDYAAWSNVDWELLAGCGRVVHEGVEYHLIASLELVNTAARQRLAERFGKTYVPPEIPPLPAAGTPAFVVTRGDPADTAATAAVSALHTYFQQHEAELVAARAARKAARLQYEAELRAHPPEPADVTVRFWQREHQASPAPETATPAAP